MINKLYDLIINEKESEINNGIYKNTQVDFAYNSRAIEGSKISYINTKAILDDVKIFKNDDVDLSMREIQMTSNHFALFDYMLYSVGELLSYNLINKFHSIFNANILNTNNKSYDNKNITQENNKIRDSIIELVSKYYEDKKIDIIDIIRLYVEFDKIHLFKDGNGEIGRMIMFRECLINNINPFIITFLKKEKLFKSLKKCKNEMNYDPMLKLIEEEQKKYFEDNEAYSNYFANALRWKSKKSHMRGE